VITTFWYVTLWSFVDTYQSFGGTGDVHIQDMSVYSILKIEAAVSSESSVLIIQSTLMMEAGCFSERVTAKLDGVTSQKNIILIFTVVRTQNYVK
jgi:hypothetical protein